MFRSRRGWGIINRFSTQHRGETRQHARVLSVTHELPREHRGVWRQAVGGYVVHEVPRGAVVSGKASGSSGRRRELDALEVIPNLGSGGRALVLRQDVAVDDESVPSEEDHRRGVVVVVHSCVGTPLGTLRVHGRAHARRREGHDEAVGVHRRWISRWILRDRRGVPRRLHLLHLRRVEPFLDGIDGGAALLLARRGAARYPRRALQLRELHRGGLDSCRGRAGGFEAPHHLELGVVVVGVHDGVRRGRGRGRGGERRLSHRERRAPARVSVQSDA